LIYLRRQKEENIFKGFWLMLKTVRGRLDLRLAFMSQKLIKV